MDQGRLGVLRRLGGKGQGQCIQPPLLPALPQPPPDGDGGPENDPQQASRQPQDGQHQQSGDRKDPDLRFDDPVIPDQPGVPGLTGKQGRDKADPADQGQKTGRPGEKPQHPVQCPLPSLASSRRSISTSIASRSRAEAIQPAMDSRAGAGRRSRAASAAV